MHKIKIVISSILAMGAMDNNAHADTITTQPSTSDQICLSRQQYNDTVNQLDQLIKSNQSLLEKAIKLEKIQQSTPNLNLDTLKIAIDKDGRVFVLDQLNGKLQIEDLNYNVNVKLNTSVVKTKQEQYGFNLSLKAAVLENYERQSDGSIKDYTSGALAIEPFYYKYFNINFVAGPRLFGPAFGVDITNHMGLLVGIGFRYDDTKTFFTGLAFDF